MVVDFTDIKKMVHNKLDHKLLNDVLPMGMNPTAENIAFWICKQVPKCYKVTVQESEGVNEIEGRPTCEAGRYCTAVHCVNKKNEDEDCVKQGVKKNEGAA